MSTRIPVGRLAGPPALGDVFSRSTCANSAIKNDGVVEACLVVDHSRMSSKSANAGSV